jgi:teichuronic acid biosynthesis glycosyltransferase TuaC
MRWIGFSSGHSRFNLLFYPSKLLALANDFQPDIIVGSSDCLHIILGKWISNKLNVIFAADLYDDYETFGLARIPFIKSLFRQSLKYASVVSCVSHSLAAYISNQIDTNATIITLPSTINQALFFPKSKSESRQLFNLPLNAPIVGTAGGLSRNKGIKTVYQAFIELAKKNSDIHFVVAGIVDKNCPPPNHPRIHYLGKIPHTQISDFFSALDVGVVYLRNTQYGELSFPQKAYEMAACKIPIVSAEVGDMKYLFNRKQNELYTADDHEDLAYAINNQLDQPYINEIIIPNWNQHAAQLQDAYVKCILAR